MTYEVYLSIGLVWSVAILVVGRGYIIRMRRNGGDAEDIFILAIMICAAAGFAPIIWGFGLAILIVLWVLGATTIPELKKLIIDLWKGNE